MSQITRSAAVHAASQLVVEYLSPTTSWSYPGSTQAKCDLLTKAFFRETMSESAHLSSEMCRMSSEEFIDGLINERVFTFAGNRPEAEAKDIKFFQVVRTLLIDIANRPFERRFLAVLADAVRESSTRIYIKEGVPHDEFLSLILTSGSHATASEYNFGYLGTYKEMIVALLLEGDGEVLGVDAQGDWHMQPFPTWRVLLHEFLHVYHILTERAPLFKELHRCLRWSNGLEKLAITGRGKLPGSTPQTDARIIETYSENTFAKMRRRDATDPQSLMRRIAHPGGTPADSTDTAPYMRFLSALTWGASGTVQRLMLANSAQASFAEEVFTSTAFSDSLRARGEIDVSIEGHGTIKVNVGEITGRVVAQLFREKLRSTLFDFTKLTPTPILEAHRAQPLQLKGKNATDLAFLDKIRKGKQNSFVILLIALNNMGRTDISAELLKQELPCVYFGYQTAQADEASPEVVQDLFEYRETLILLAKEIPGCAESILPPLEKEAERSRAAFVELLAELEPLGTLLEEIRKGHGL